MTATESKEEISDTDSGIILHSGPESPTSPVKDLTTHTRALRVKHQFLEERLELCLLELRKLCVREAELTGTLPSDFPLTPDEKPPRVRRRIGASFKLDEDLICRDQQDSELKALETDLAVQQQIYEAVRKLSLEENLSKPQKKSRLQQCKKEEKKVKELKEAVFQHRIKSECNSPCISVSSSQNKDMSDDSSLSDVVALDDDSDSPCPLSPPVLGSSPTEPLLLSDKIQQKSLQPSGLDNLEYERSPIQNSPWKESSLDQSYERATKLECADRSRSSSPTGKPLPAETCRIPLTQFVRNSALRHSSSTSAPSTPELLVRRQYSQSFRIPKRKPSVEAGGLGSESNRGNVRSPQQHWGPDAVLRSTEYPHPHPLQSNSQDGTSEPDASSHTCSPRRDRPTEIPKLCPPPYGFHFGAQRELSVYRGVHRSGSQPQASPAQVRVSAPDTPHSPQDKDVGKGFPSPPQKGASPSESPLKPPPPYTRLVRTPSLKEYPNHAARLMPREMVSEELKSWHQRNQMQKFWPSKPPGVTSPTSPHLPPFNQRSGNVVLQRAADGTPVQWFIAEDAEIVSQV